MLSLAALFFCALPQGGGAVDFGQACLDASTDAVVLNVAAHPDDEAARTMVLLRHRFGVRTVTLYSTCGGGGQNAIGREIGGKLAALRVRETMAAADHTGTVVRWLGFPDFGYSKTQRETLAVWGEQKLLDAMRQAITAAAPDLAFTNHGIDRGHGHHRASAWALAEVCKSQPGGHVIPLYRRVWKGEAAIAFDPFEIDSVRGETYARQAHAGWLEHATQGPWGPHNPMRVRKESWERLLPVPAEGEGDADFLARLPSVFDSPRFRQAVELQGYTLASLAAELEAFRGDRSRAAHVAAARRLLPELHGLRTALEAEPETLVRLDRRIDALTRVVVIGTGIGMETWLVDSSLAPGAAGRLRVHLRGAGLQAINFRSVDAELKLRPVVEKKEGSDDTTASSPVENALPPGWVELSMRLAGTARDAFESLSQTRLVRLRAEFTSDGLPLFLEKTVSVPMAPQVEVVWGRDIVSIPAEREGWQRVVSLEVRWQGDGELTAPLVLRHPAGVQVEAIPPQVRLSSTQRKVRVLVRIRGDGARLDRRSEISARVEGGARARMELQPLAVTVASKLKIGLVRGPDDTIHRFFEDLAVPFDLLDETALATADLNSFSTILLDIRAYHHRPDLANHRERLHRFMRAGGRVVSLYHKEREWNPALGKPQLAPFDLTVGRKRVSEENAAVVFLKPEHALFNHPHQIVPADFVGWVQERGLNFPSAWDVAWTPLLSMHDVGEDPLEGSLLYTDYGQGDFVYCSLALYRQLRKGHLGAARIMLNLLTPMKGS